MPTLGTLEGFPILERLDLVATPVAAAAKSLNAARIAVAEIDPTLSDTAAFCAQYQVALHDAANCVILEAKRGDMSWYAACVVLGSTRADVNGLVRKTLDARRVSFAPMDAAVSLTGMEYGAITPIGLPPEWPILIDKAVADAPAVVIGSGLRRSKIVVPGSVFSTLPGAQVIENVARTVE